MIKISKFRLNAAQSEAVVAWSKSRNESVTATVLHILDAGLAALGKPPRDPRLEQLIEHHDIDYAALGRKLAEPLIQARMERERLILERLKELDDDLGYNAGQGAVDLYQKLTRGDEVGP